MAEEETEAPVGDRLARPGSGERRHPAPVAGHTLLVAGQVAKATVVTRVGPEPGQASAARSSAQLEVTWEQT